MYCKRCEKELEKHEVVCPYCGTNIRTKKIKKIIFLTLIILILLTVSSIFIINMLNEKKELKNLSNQKVDVLNLTKEKYITFGQYTFKLVDNLQYNSIDNYIYAATPDLTTAFKMNIVNANYNTIKENEKKFLESIVASGINVVSYYLTTIDNIEYILIATVQNNKNYLYAIRELDNYNIVQVLIESTMDDGYEKSLINVNSIVKDYKIINFNLNIKYTSSINDFFSDGTNAEVNLGDLFKK